ncbi:MAG: Smr/MutS family protein [bacterium]
MNSLLERIAAAAEVADCVPGGQTERAHRLLEWSRILEQIAGFCHNHLAADLVRQRRPHGEMESIRLWWQLADEIRPFGESGRWPPLTGVSGVIALLESPPPLQLEGEDLVHIAGVAVDLDILRDYFLDARAVVPTWGAAAIQLATFGSVAAAVNRALDRDGQLLPSASPLLARLRDAVSAQERTVRREVEAAMAEARRQGWTTGDEVTLRGDRYCLPLRSGSRRQVQGIMHARSASGGTHYVEPAAVVQLHNELAERRLAAAAEEARILLELNRAVEQARGPLLEACRFLLLVDQVRAGMLWSREYQGRRPTVAVRGRLRICGGYHPLLLQYGPGGLAGRQAVDSTAATGTRQVRRDDVVPLDLELPADKRVVVLSGPNAGGKSVALKTVGVFSLLAQCGWDVPAREDTELPLIRRLFVDLGDEQSIEMSLSSFSAHMGHLVDFLGNADADSLVLCDEIGGGTDPQEGTALAFTVLAGLASSGSHVLASTHFGLLKAAVLDHPQMVNAAMAYDEETFRPRFTFQLGVPGASHAFDIAQRWGFPDDLLEQARQLVGEERFQLEKLLTELTSRSRSLAASERESRTRLAELREQQRALDRRLRRIEKERRQVLADTRQAGEQLLKQGRQRLEQVVRDIRNSGGDKVVIRTARERIASLSEQLPSLPPPPDRPPELTPGARIRIPHLGMTGQILEIRGDKIFAVADGMRLTLNRAAVAPAAAPPGEPVPDDQPTSTPGGWRWHDDPPEVRHEIDLRGERGEDAWQQLDHLIDRAIPAGLAEIRVIHGVGTGRLREYLHHQLARDTRVSHLAEAPLNQGGHGVTLIRLA